MLMPDPFFSGKAAYQKRRKFSSSQLALYGWSSLFGKKVTLVLVYKCGQESYTFRKQTADPAVIGDQIFYKLS